MFDEFKFPQPKEPPSTTLFPITSTPYVSLLIMTPPDITMLAVLPVKKGLEALVVLKKIEIPRTPKVERNVDVP